MGDKMTNQGIYSRGNSFRAIAEAKAREYRVSELNLDTFDKYGHILTDHDAEIGMNFLPSMRNEILEAVKKRREIGKGIHLQRTTKNMLSSQAMCFNLFVPLNSDLGFASAFIRFLLGDVKEIRDRIQYEYTPSNTIFNDQSVRSGVDCDILLTYINNDNQKSLLVIETKFVETEFSICGFRKSKQRDKCPNSTVISTDFSNCRYDYKKGYNYWKVANESGLFDMNFIQRNSCPFGDSKWQLWTNMSLAFALSKEMGCSEFSYAVVCHEKNNELSNNGKTFDEFRNLLKNPNKFKVIYLCDIKEAFEKMEGSYFNREWALEFINRYCNY
jgi:hypothetical protein